jgi:hypothetical protein
MATKLFQPIEVLPVRADVEYTFKGGFPTSEAVKRIDNDVDLNPAVQAYQFFYPIVSAPTIKAGNESLDNFANKGALVVRDTGVVFHGDSPLL